MKLLVIDIETTGLRRESHEITVVALAELDSVDGSLHNARCVNLLRARDGAGGDRAAQALLAEICAEMDACQRIVAFNGIDFDLPFIAHKAGLNGRASEWASKTIDFCAFIQQHSGSRVSMSALCTTNQVPVDKCATGKDAVVWARERNHAKLEEYCLQDVYVLAELTRGALRGPLHADAGPYHRRSSVRVAFGVDRSTCVACMYTHPDRRKRRRVGAGTDAGSFFA